MVATLAQDMPAVYSMSAYSHSTGPLTEPLPRAPGGRHESLTIVRVYGDGRPQLQADARASHARRNARLPPATPLGGDAANSARDVKGRHEAPPRYCRASSLPNYLRCFSYAHGHDDAAPMPAPRHTPRQERRWLRGNTRIARGRATARGASGATLGGRRVASPCVLPPRFFQFMHFGLICAAAFSATASATACRELRHFAHGATSAFPG